MKPPNSIASQRGFTLLEVLVTLTIFAFIALLASLGIHQAAVSQVRLQRLETSARRMAGLDAFLRPILSQAAPPTLFRDPSVGVFVGDGQQISFLGPLRWDVGALDLARYSLKFEPNGTLRVRWALDPSLGGGEQTTGEEALFDGVQAGQFAYLADGAAATDENWASEWHRQGELPRLVRVVLEREGVRSELVFALLRFRPPCKSDNVAGQSEGAC